MKKAELDKLIADGATLADAISNIEIDNDNIWCRESLLDFAIYQINEGRLSLARHILDAVDKDYADWYSYDAYADWYNYDANMGTLETPTAIDDVEDLYDYVED